MQNLHTRPATVHDVGLIHQLAQQIWRAHYPSIIGAEQVEYMLNRMYAPGSLTHQITQQGHTFILCFSGDKPVGYCSYSLHDNGNCFLHKFYIIVSQHHQGLGTWFFHTMFNNLSHLTSLRLTVNRKNFKAINFYFKLGFVIEEVKDFDIDNGFWMKDFVMVKKIAQS